MFNFLNFLWHDCLSSKIPFSVIKFHSNSKVSSILFFQFSSIFFFQNFILNIFIEDWIIKIFENIFLKPKLKKNLPNGSPNRPRPLCSMLENVTTKSKVSEQLEKKYLIYLSHADNFIIFLKSHALFSVSNCIRLAYCMK